MMLLLLLMIISFTEALIIMVSAGVLLCWHLQRCKQHRRQWPLPFTGAAYSDATAVLAVLQHLQAVMVVLGPTTTVAGQMQTSACLQVTLADVVALLNSMQLDFGAHTPLETVIMTLVAQDLRRQWQRRKSKLLYAGSRLPL